MKLRVWDNGKGLKGRLTALDMLTCKPGGYSAMPPPVRRSSCDAEGKGITAALRLHVAFITMCNYMRVTSGPRYPYVCYCMSICPRSQQSLKPQSTGVPSPLSARVPAPRRRSIDLTKASRKHARMIEHGFQVSCSIRPSRSDHAGTHRT